MKSKEMLQKIVNELDEHFKNDENSKLKEYKFDIEEDPKHDSHILRVTVKTTLRTKKFKITSSFVDSPEYQDLVNHYEGIFKVLRFNFRNHD